MNLLFSVIKSGRCAGKLVPDLTKYLSASVMGTFAHYSLMMILIRGGAVSVLLASTVGAITGALIIYLFNYFYTFRSQKGHLESVSKFFMVAALGLGMNGVVLKAALVYLDWHYLVAQCLATTAVFGLSFTINRAWTF